MEEFPKNELEQLWAPWRVEYFERKARGEDGDFLLNAAQATDDAEHLVVERRKATFLIMNRYPYTSGHLMAVPYRKVADLHELTPEEKAEIWDLAELAQSLLRKVCKAQGFNIGLNLGEAAGAGVEDHLHLHIVPRWKGDTNFITTLGQTRVIPEGLMPMYEKLVEAKA